MLRSEIGKDVDCTFERFLALAEENSRITTKGVKEACSILIWEAQCDGKILVSRPHPKLHRDMTIDFVVKGTNEYKHVTHAEVKGFVTVESLLFKKDPDKAKSGIASYEEMMTSILIDAEKQIQKNLNTPGGPESRSNVLLLIDLDSVPSEAIERYKLNNISKDNVYILNPEGREDVIWTHKRDEF